MDYYIYKNIKIDFLVKRLKENLGVFSDRLGRWYCNLLYQDDDYIKITSDWDRSW